MYTYNRRLPKYAREAGSGIVHLLVSCRYLVTGSQHLHSHFVVNSLSSYKISLDPSIHSNETIVTSALDNLKGQRHKIFFFASCFFHKWSSPKLTKIKLELFQIFSKSPGAPRCKFATGTAGVVDIGAKIANGVNNTSGKWWKQTITDCWHLRVNLKEKNIFVLTPLPKGVQTK